MVERTISQAIQRGLAKRGRVRVRMGKTYQGGKHVQKLKLTLWILLLVSPVAVAQTVAQSATQTEAQAAVGTGSAQDALVPLLSELKSTLDSLGSQFDHASGPSSGEVRQNVEALSLRVDTLLGMMQEQTGGAVIGGAVTGGAVTGGAVTGGSVTGGAATGGASATDAQAELEAANIQIDTLRARVEELQAAREAARRARADAVTQRGGAYSSVKPHRRVG